MAQLLLWNALEPTLGGSVVIFLWGHGRYDLPRSSRDHERGRRRMVVSLRYNTGHMPWTHTPEERDNDLCLCWRGD
jgi:hypothetical protein